MIVEYPPKINNQEFDNWAERFVDTLRIGELELQSLTVTNFATINQYRLGQVGSWDISENTISNGTITLDAAQNRITVDEIIIDGAENEIRIADNITLDADAEKIKVGGSTPYLDIDGGNTRIRSSNYVSGYAGAGFTLEPGLLEVGNIAARGMIRTSVFQKDIISAVGGNLWVRSADVLSSDMTAADASTLTIEGNETFSVGDFLRIKDGTDDEWMEVTNIGSAPTYTVTRDKDAQYGADANPAWKKGASVVNFGASGAGGIYLTASEENAPYLSVYTQDATPWDGLTTQVRAGNLNGSYGISADKFGLAAGDSSLSDHYIIINGTDGTIAMKGSITITSGAAPWSLVTDDDGNKPANNADVTANNAQAVSWLTDAGALATGDTLDDVPEGSTYKRVAATYLSSGRILLAEAFEVDAGTYGLVNATAISAGKIVLTSDGVTGTLSTTLTEAKNTNALADQTSANSQDLDWIDGTTGTLTISSTGNLLISATGKFKITSTGDLTVETGSAVTFEDGTDLKLEPSDSSPSKIIFEDSGAGTYDIEISRANFSDGLYISPTTAGQCKFLVGYFVDSGPSSGVRQFDEIRLWAADTYIYANTDITIAASVDVIIAGTDDVSITATNDDVTINAGDKINLNPGNDPDYVNIDNLLRLVPRDSAPSSASDGMIAFATNSWQSATSYPIPVFYDATGTTWRRFDNLGGI